MKIVQLSPKQFDNYSFYHPLHTYYQTSAYGSLMQSTGYLANYYGFIDDNGRLVGASLILTKKLMGNYDYAYAPRGFLTNYQDRNLVADITRNIKGFLEQEKTVFLKIDPPVFNNLRNKNGEIIPSPYSNNTVGFLQKIGYNYFGESKFFGTLKPRWNAILQLNMPSKKLFENLDNSVRNKIRKAQSRGIEVVRAELNPENLEIFYSFVAKKHTRKLNYYKSLAKTFQNNFEIYFARLNSDLYLKNIKILYEAEYTKNESINLQIQEAGAAKNISPKLTNTKMTSDKLLQTYKNEMNIATELFKKFPKGIIIGTIAVISQGKKVELLIDGLNESYKLYYPTFLLKWYIIETFGKRGYKVFDMNAITGYFKDNNKFRGLNEMKLGYNSDVIEYIGEFDLVIKPERYALYSRKSSLSKKIKNNN